MAPGRPYKYVPDEDALDGFKSSVKLLPCPHCRRVGALVGHGFLRGYADTGGDQVVRGRRFFCSNRFRRPGCGRTFAVLLAGVLARFVVRLPTLFSFAHAVLAGASRRAAWKATVARAMSLQTAYRLWRRLCKTQVSLRARLCRVCPPPDSTAAEPMAQLLQHMQRAFPQAACPLSAFQTHFEVGLWA
jgi:hypothetical protein